MRNIIEPLRNQKKRANRIEIASIACLCIVIATLVASWVFSMPPMQFPDEIAHSDYAFALYDAGKPFMVRAAQPAREVMRETRYLVNSNQYRELRYNIDARIRNPKKIISTDASSKPSGHIRPKKSEMPYVMFSYPATYYVLVACAMRIEETITHGSLENIFYTGRLLGTLFLVGTTIMAWRAFRVAGFEKHISVAYAGATGLFPLCVTTSSAIQPDALTLMTSVAVVYAANRLIAQPIIGNVTILAGTVGTLLLVKPHNGAAFWFASCCLVLCTKNLQKPVVSRIMMIAIPSMAAILAITITPVRGLTSVVSLIMKKSANATPAELLRNGIDALTSIFLSGTAISSFWMEFGFRGAYYIPATHGTIQVIGATGIVIAIILATSYVARVTRYTARVHNATERFQTAVKIVGSNFPLVCTVATVTILIAIYEKTGIPLQGRYLITTILPMNLIIAGSLPKIVENRTWRKNIALTISILAITMSTTTTISGLTSIRRYYFDTPQTESKTDFLADVEEIRLNRKLVDIQMQTTERKNTLTITGHAIDIQTGLPAMKVIVRIDGRIIAIANPLENRQSIAEIFGDPKIKQSGFQVTIKDLSVSKGEHLIKLTTSSPGYPELEFKRQLTISRK